MGFWSRLLGVDSYDAAQRVLSPPFEPFISSGGIPVMDPGTPLEYWVSGERTEIERFWRTQPNVRKVVDYIARNVASIPMHTFERVSDVERQRVTGHPLPDLLGQPRPGVGPYRFWHAVLSDGLLYDRWLLLKHTEADGRLTLVQVPSWRTRFKTDALRRVVAIKYWVGDDRQGVDGWIDVDLDAAIFDHGYAPATAGLSPVSTLRDVLDESAEAVSYRRQVWENGGRFDQYIHRPTDAGGWTDEQRQRWVDDFRSAYTGKGGVKAGGMPFMEDGMKIIGVERFSPHDAMDLEGRRLTAIEVAAAFHIAPEMVGAREGNYSNMKEFRQSLYRDSLGPYITAWEEVLNAQLVPELAGGRKFYVEANVKAKLRGSFEEEAKIGQASVGAPTMTRNEWRARQNMPPVEGGDELITPLNVVTGAQASPLDSGTQNEKRVQGVQVKSRAPEAHEAKHEEVLTAFFARQEAAIRSRLGSKAAVGWWDEQRWKTELSADLLRLALMTSEWAAGKTLLAAGFTGSAYDLERTIAYLTKVAEGDAERINEATRQRIAEALESDADVDEVFESNKGRASILAAALVTAASSFGTVEAAKQQSPQATKTWRTTSGNSRSAHKSMNGETVAVDDTFSNGLPWPGAYGDPDDVAGCKCTVDITIPEPEEG